MVTLFLEQVGAICSFQNFKKAFEASGLTGIKEFNPVEIISKVSHRKNLRLPLLFEAVIQIRQTQVLFGQMSVTWMRMPAKNFCSLCGPGGGGKNGVYESYEKIVVDKDSILDCDIFYAINFSGVILFPNPIFSTRLQFDPTAIPDHALEDCPPVMACARSISASSLRVSAIRGFERPASSR